MFLSRNPNPIAKLAMIVSNTLIGSAVPSDLTLIKVVVYVFPDGRIYYGEGTPDFIMKMQADWEKDLTQRQVEIYSIPEIQMAANVIWMYKHDYEQVRSFPEVANA